MEPIKQVAYNLHRSKSAAFLIGSYLVFKGRLRQVALAK